MMGAVGSALRVCADHGRYLLIAGLVAGIILPSMAQAMRPVLPQLVALLLFIAALRIGPRQALGAARDLPATLCAALVFQLAAPVLFLLAVAASGSGGGAAALALGLMLAASPIAGGPNLALMTGNDPAPALRLLILGTALLPVTVLPVFWLMPELGSAKEILAPAARLLIVIAAAVISAFALCAVFMKRPRERTLKALDGLSAVAMAVVVIGLMSAVGPALTGNPGEFLVWLLFAFAANFSMQAIASLVLPRLVQRAQVAPLAILAGNRNIALFLVALPSEVIDPVLLFIGCYQIPMYLTPVLLDRLHRPSGA